MERRIDPFMRPLFDAVLREPLARLTTALINWQRKDEGLKIAEERPLPNEEANLEAIITTFKQQMSGLWKPGGFERGGNTKTHGIVRAELVVHDDLSAAVSPGNFSPCAARIRHGYVSRDPARILRRISTTWDL